MSDQFPPCLGADRKRLRRRTLVDSRQVPRNRRTFEPVDAQVDIGLDPREMNTNARPTVAPLVDVVLPLLLVFCFFGVGAGSRAFTAVACERGKGSVEIQREKGRGEGDVPPQTAECLR